MQDGLVKDERKEKMIKMSCFTEVDETKNFYAFRVRSPAIFKKEAIPQVVRGKRVMVDFVTPRWARHVAESVATGAYVTMGIIAKTGKWATQSIKVPLAGRTTREARQLAMRIAGKLKACPEAAAMNREKACGKPVVAMAWEERSEASKEFERKKMLERFGESSRETAGYKEFRG